MPANTPTRIDDDLFAAAKATGAVLSRSAAQQVNHWARIGRQLEASGVLRARDIELVLAGAKSYDDLNPFEQAAVRAEWEEQIGAHREGIDLTGELGDTWVEANLAGRPVRRKSPAAAPAAAGAPAAAKPRRRRAS